MIVPAKTYGIYYGKVKEENADTIFASIYTLSSQKHLHSFHPAEFDLIIVDEFHHAAADSYKRVLDYFKPAFLLGITATPDRNDNKDVYATCDGNVANKLDFLAAISREWLAPFNNGWEIDIEQELLQAQLRDDMAVKILSAWRDKKQTRTIDFHSFTNCAIFVTSLLQSSKIMN
ncbi:DEAD/DEAH box helicase family protein [Peribacillus saganii]|uniref:DEAD/DEAH box helicase family protein n=1 Tax=Peribacillus saganii TaxID=2303992 RepID=UPI0026A74F65